MKEGLFRQEALDHLNAPEPLDEPIEIAPLHGWLAWLGLALLAGSGFAMACLVKIPVEVRGRGTLTVDNRSTSTAQGRNLKAVLQFPLTQSERIRPGMLAHLTPDGTSPELYGFLEGRVLQVNPAPATAGTNQKQVAVHIALLPDPRNGSGFHWTLQRANTPHLTADTACFGTVILSEQPLLALLWPAWGGIN